YYINQGGFSKTPAATMATLIAPIFGGVAGAPGDPGSIYSNVGQAYGTGSTLGLSPDQGANNPSAFINFILFDKDYKLLDGKSMPISTTANKPQPVALPEITALEVGYVFIYLSYDNAAGGDVFFDDLKITVQESPVIQVNNYYPFGLQSYTWLREGETDNAYLYQGKELIAQTGWHDFGSRMYYADLGRWFATDPQKQFGSPYLAMGNIPTMGVDPDGEFAFLPLLASLAMGALKGAVISGVTTMISNGLHGRSWDSGLGQSLLAGAIGGGIAGGLGYVGSSIKGMEAFARSTTYGAMKGVASDIGVSAAMGRPVTPEGIFSSLAGGFLDGAFPQFRGVAGKGFGNGLANLGLDLGISSLRGGARGALSSAIQGGDVGEGFMNGMEGGFISSAITNAYFGRPKLLTEFEDRKVRVLMYRMARGREREGNIPAMRIGIYKPTFR
ncbi:MAG: RHS repeat domain-containing protein, partial [Cytophagales bacterium]